MVNGNICLQKIIDISNSGYICAQFTEDDYLHTNNQRWEFKRLWERDISLPTVTNGGGGIEVWTGIAYGFRKMLHGGSFGLPVGMFDSNGNLDMSALISVYAVRH